MDDKDMMILLIALLKLQGLTAKASTVSEALADSRREVDLYQQGQSALRLNLDR